LFTEAGVLSYPPGTDEDKIMEAALEAGAEDVVKQSDGGIDVLTTPCQFVAVQDTMITAGQEPANAEVTMHAGTYIILRDEQAEKMLRLLDTLEDQDDVQNVYANADFPDEVLERLR
jgi:transcriptional/translational regulatory protein YebC/TACO1